MKEGENVNLIAAINTKVIPVAAYPMNVCKFSKEELNELNQVIKRELQAKNMLGRQASDERLYMKREQGGRGLRSMKDVVNWSGRTQEINGCSFLYDNNDNIELNSLNCTVYFRLDSNSTTQNSKLQL